MIYFGVDVGKKGAIAYIQIEGDKVADVDVKAMPIAGKEIDLSLLVTWLKFVKSKTADIDNNYVAYIEKVHAMPQQGVKSTFSFGFNTGVIHGVLAALNIPRKLVTPQAWKKKVLAGTPKTKEAAIDYCRMRYPEVNLYVTARSTTCNDGMADALCIAEYGYGIENGL